MNSARPLCVAIALAAAMLTGATAPAGAQHGSWLIEYLSGWYSEPAMINAEQPTTLFLWGWFPYTCGQVADARVVDSAHVELTLRPGPACEDTVTVWHQGFDLGLLPPGYHTLHVRRLFYAAGADTPQVAENSFTFYVEPSATPPPPPPQCREHASVLIRGLSGWYTQPDPPNDQAATTLVLWGWFPYDHGEVVDAAVLAPDHVRFTLRQDPARTDTVATWTQAFALGVLPKGQHNVRVEMRVQGDSCDASTVRNAYVTVQVGEQMVSASVPNPFVHDTRFSVTQGQAEQVDVAVYDPAGRRVATLFQGVLPVGTHVFRWSGRNDDGSDAPIGIYFSRVAFSNRVVTRRLVMLPGR